MTVDAVTVTAIIPVHNGRAFVGDAIRSVLAQRAWFQAVEWDLVVVDDGSTDGSAEVAQSLVGPSRVVSQPQRGPAAARNAGLARATGAFVAFLDADDLWPPERTDVLLRRLLGDPGLDAALGRVRYVDLDGSEGRDMPFEDPQERTISFVHLGTGLYRRELLVALGGFSEDLRFSEDHDFFLRVREAGRRFVVLPDVTLEYRLHAANMTNGRTMAEFGLTEVLRRSLARRRANGHSQQSLPRWSAHVEPAGVAPVTVVIPAFEAGRYLDEAVASALAQSPRPAEVLVVDDGSTDGAPTHLAPHPAVRVIRRPHGGPGAARNTGVQAATQPLVAFLDADDLWRAGKLAIQLAVLRAAADVDMVFGGVQPFVSPELHGQITNSARAADTAHLPGTMLVRAEALHRVGPFREDVLAGEFIDWYHRAREAGLVERSVDAVVLDRRLHGANTSSSLEAQRSYLAVARAALRRGGLA